MAPGLGPAGQAQSDSGSSRSTPHSVVENTQSAQSILLYHSYTPLCIYCRVAYDAEPFLSHHDCCSNEKG